MTHSAERLVKERLRQEGAIPFRDFMEMALYARGSGYYTSGQPGLDYYTSPATHPAFGSLVGLQLDQVWRALGCPSPFTVVEMGSGRGLLARDILSSPFHPPSLKATRYVLLERGRVATPVSDSTEAVTGQGVPLKSVVGCFLANELWDAFPVHRVTTTGGRLREAYVALEGDRLVEVYDEPSTPDLQAYLDEYDITLAEGQRTEVNLEMVRHVGEVARSLKQGVFVSVDYGYTEAERVSRNKGSLRCFYRHTVHSDPYVHVGEQDITSSVDFGVAMKAAEKADLTILGLVPQGLFLKNLGLDVLLQRLPAAGLSPSEYNAEAMALRELSRPGELGDFRVLIMGKGVEGLSLDCLKADNAIRRALLSRPDLPLPRLRSAHAAVLAARYPHLAWTPPEDGE